MRTSSLVAGVGTLALGCADPHGRQVGAAASSEPSVGEAQSDGIVGAATELRIDAASEATDSVGSRLCALSTGAALVAWTDARDGEQAVWARSSPDGGATWPDAPVRVSSPGAAADHPSLACAGGAAWLAWEDQRDSALGRANVYVAGSWDGGGTWAPGARVGAEPELEASHFEPRVAASGEDVHVVWYSDENGAYDVFVASSRDGGATFGARARLDSDVAGAAWSAHPVVGVDDGAVVVAWEDRRDGVVDVYAATSDDGGLSWGADARLDGGTGDSFAPTVAVEAGDAWVAWHDERDGEHLEVYAAYRSAGAGWAEPQRVNEGAPEAGDEVLPRIALLAGTLHAVWFQAAEGGYHVAYRAMSAGAPVGPTVQLDQAPDTALTTYPELAVGPAGVVVAWQDDRAVPAGQEGNDLYYASSSDGGATWSPEQRLDAHADGSTYAVDAALAVDAGDVVAAWSDGRGGTADVYFNRLPLGAGVARRNLGGGR